MTQITGVGFSNFRVFKERTQFDIAPISIFTGTNSSGKSSIFKSLMLMKQNTENFSKLSFSGEEHKLGTFLNSKNNQSDKGEIEFEIGIDRAQEIISNGNTLFINKIYCTNTYEQEHSDSEGGKLTYSKIFINDNNKSVLDWADMLVFIEQKDESVIFYFNLNYFLNKLRDEILPVINKDKDSIKINVSEDHISYSGLSNDSSKYFYWISRLLKIINSDFKVLNKSFLINRNKISKLLSAEELENLVFHLEELVLNKFTVFEIKHNIHTYYNGGSIIKEYDNFFQQYKELLSLGNSLTKNIKDMQVYDFIGGKLKDIDGGLLNNLTISQVLSEEFIFICKEFISPEVDYILNDLKFALENVNYIGSNRANSQRLYTNQSQGTTFNQLLLEVGQKWAGITKNKESIDSSFNFVQKWIKSFGIGEEIAITRSKGIATEVIILKNGVETDLIDLGYGATQFLPILLNIATNYKFKEDSYNWIQDAEIFKNNGPLLLIEEPEANLHPRLQSLLADFFIDVAKQFEVTLLIETHSEYLIRRLQVLTASNEVQPEDTVIYYLNGEAEKTGDGFVTKININPDGSLTNDFGPGFIDEATNWKMELMRLKHAQLQNLN